MQPGAHCVPVERSVKHTDALIHLMDFILHLTQNQALEYQHLALNQHAPKQALVGFIYTGICVLRHA